MVEVNIKRSLRQQYSDARGESSDGLIKLVCATQLIGAGLMSADEPIESVDDYYKRLGHDGCRACALVEKCAACFMCY